MQTSGIPGEAVETFSTAHARCRVDIEVDRSRNASPFRRGCTSAHSEPVTSGDSAPNSTMKAQDVSTLSCAVSQSQACYVVEASPRECSERVVGRVNHSQ